MLAAFFMGGSEAEAEAPASQLGGGILDLDTGLLTREIKMCTYVHLQV